MAETRNVDVDHRPPEDRVVIRIGGDTFTEYRYRDDLAKPVLYPIRSAKGTAVTRGYPLNPAAGERVDHSHHVGSWLNYGHVNGHDFWNYDGDTPLEDTEDGGIVRHDAVEAATGGAEGLLRTAATWVTPDGPALVEDTTYSFGGTENTRYVDRSTTLSPTDGAVELHGDKEGLFAVRVATGIEHPTDGATTRLTEDGDTGAVETPPGDTPSGEYYSSASAKGPAVWGTKARWVRLTGVVDSEEVSVTIMDHPNNVGHPTHWHARQYGLFAANPLAPEIFSGGEEEPLRFELGADDSVTFRFRLAVDVGKPTAATLRDRFDRFAGSQPPGVDN